MKSSWYQKACEEADSDLDSGLITSAEHQAVMRDLGHQLREEAEESGLDAYNDVMWNC